MSDQSKVNKENLDFSYGKKTVGYDLIYEDRDTLAITVDTDKSIVVKAPMQSGIEDIQKKLKKRGKWILKQVNYFDKFHPVQPERQYVSGETHYYLGRQYRLRVRKSGQESVKLIGKFFIVEAKNLDDNAQIKKLMMRWYADHAKLLMDRRALAYISQILGSGFSDIEIIYRFLKKYWGVWNPDRSLTFNIELIKTPIQCVDYVIVHELCHLVYPKHDESFYWLLGRILPDWVERKEKLEIFGAK